MDSELYVNGSPAPASPRVEGQSQIDEIVNFSSRRARVKQALQGLPVNDRGKGGTNRRRITFGADFPFRSPQHLVYEGSPRPSFSLPQQRPCRFAGMALTPVFRHGTGLHRGAYRRHRQNSCDFARQPPVGRPAADCQADARMFFIQRGF